MIYLWLFLSEIYEWAINVLQRLIKIMHKPAELACQAWNPIALERLLQGWRVSPMLISHDFLELNMLGE